MTNPTATASKAQFARIAGRTRQSIGDLCARGKLTALPDGRIPIELGLLQLQAVRGYASPAAAPAPATHPPAASSEAVPDYRRARAEREGFAAQRERMALQREARELLPAAEVHDAIDDAAALCRTALEQLPDRLAPRLAAIGADEGAAHALLAVAVDDALRALCGRLEDLASEAPAS